MELLVDHDGERGYTGVGSPPNCGSVPPRVGECRGWVVMAGGGSVVEAFAGLNGWS